MQGEPYQQNYGGYPPQAQYDHNGQPINNGGMYSNAEVVSSAEHNNHQKGGNHMTDDEVSDQMKFVRKVYSILAIQLTLTAVLIAMVQYSEDFKIWAMKAVWLQVLSAIGSMVTACMIICCFGRQVPLNFILLTMFTLFEGFMIATITARYD